MLEQELQLLVHAPLDGDSAAAALGEPGYSAHFVLQAFMPVLEKLGTVTRVSDPEREVDPLYQRCLQEGKPCLFLDFRKPNQLNLELGCPTLPVFACEFDTIPTETWDSNLQNDWRYALGRVGWGITHSSHTLHSIQRDVRQGFPAIVAPAPVWDSFAKLAAGRRGGALDRGFRLETDNGYLIDSRDVDLAQFSTELRANAEIPPPLREAASLEISGVVYTALLNPWDEAKNWKDLIWTFCWALKDRADATLVIKLTCPGADDFIETLLHDVYKMTPISCRIVIASGYLSDASYSSLAANTTYTVSSSRAEGQALPMMEFMSAGAPAIAPCHSALAEFISRENAFVVASSVEPTWWAEDPRHRYRSLWYRLNWESMVAAFQESYRVVGEEPERYAQMSRAASDALEAFCSQSRIYSLLEDYFSDILRSLRRYSPKTPGAS